MSTSPIELPPLDAERALPRLTDVVSTFELRRVVDLLLDDLDAVPPASPAERSAHRAAVAARPSGSGRMALVVDSQAAARQALMGQLEALGYRTRGADSGEQALAMIERERCVVVCLELNLSSGEPLDGLALCQAIKQRAGRSAAAPAVMIVTARLGSSDRVRGALAGCDAYLTKPFAEADFVAVLADVDPLFK